MSYATIDLSQCESTPEIFDFAFHTGATKSAVRFLGRTARSTLQAAIR